MESENRHRYLDVEYLYQGRIQGVLGVRHDMDDMTPFQTDSDFMLLALKMHWIDDGSDLAHCRNVVGMLT